MPPQRDTPDPTSAPIRRVLNAFQGNSNSSGTSTKAALQQLDEIREAVPTVPFADTESGAAIAAATGRAPTSPPANDRLDPTPASVAVQAAGAGFVVEAPPLPAPPVVPSSSAAGAASTAGAATAAAVAALRGDGTPAAISREASNSTSPGAASFAEGPSSVGRADDFDESDRRAIAPARAFNIVAFLKTTRGMAIAGGAAVLVIVLLVVALKGGGDSKKTSGGPKKNAKTVVATTDNGSADSQADENGGAGGAAGMHLTNAGRPSGAGEGDGETAPDDGSGAEGTGSDASAETGSDAVAPEHPVKKGGTEGPKKAGPTIGGKQVVLEYDNQARDAAAVPNNAAKSDQGAISKARTSYAAGNQRLFAGDADGAIRYYKQALGYYPAYVAGYRGLGLAYSQQGNKAAAVQAFRTYVSSVPSAKDTPLIRKRIANLQAK